MMQPPYEPVTSPDGPPPQPPRKRHWVRWTAAGATGALIVGLVAAGVSGGPGGGANAGPVASSPAASAPASIQQATFTDPFGVKCAPSDEDNAGYCTGDDPSPSGTVTETDSPAPADTPAVTSSQQQALDSAQSYLSDGQGFSRAGLIDQLSSSAGEGFSHADAVWAADHSGADWKAQAVLSAQGYLRDGQGFSRSGLIEQLTSPYGEQFTLAQATYAVNKVGL
jgi:hypothetical protein